MSRSTGGSPPFPSRQMFVLALCRICEPIAFMSIFPYVYYMVRSFRITNDEKQLAVYVGMVTSAFAFAEFSSGVVWGRISDRIGRKPVLLCGLAGTALSMIVFGFAPSLPIALLGRALGGLLNGNMGVLQTTVAEIVKVKSQQPKAYSIMPFVWCLGSILGPALGGALAQPCDNYPTIFARGTVFDQHPFLLPNLICAAILVVGVLVGILFLEETHPEKKSRHDYGLEMGQHLLKWMSVRSPLSAVKTSDYNVLDACDPLPGEGAPSRDSAKTLSTDYPVSVTTSKDAEIGSEASTAPARAAQRAFTKQVVSIIAGFGILAFHSISFDQLMPVFLSEPVSHQTVSLPFRFSGGFGLTTKTIGFMLSVQGVYSMIAQLFIFPCLARKYGTLKTFRTVVMVWPILYFFIPYLVLLPSFLQKPAIYACLLLKITFQVIAFPSNAILLTNSAPSTLVLGIINGVAASTASLARAFGPTLTGVIHVWGLSFGCTGLAWWVSGIVCAIGALQSLWMKEVTNGRMDQEQDFGNSHSAAIKPSYSLPAEKSRPLDEPLYEDTESTHKAQA